MDSIMSCNAAWHADSNDGCSNNFAKSLKAGDDWKSFLALIILCSPVQISRLHAEYPQPFQPSPQRYHAGFERWFLGCDFVGPTQILPDLERSWRLQPPSSDGAARP